MMNNKNWIFASIIIIILTLTITGVLLAGQRLMWLNPGQTNSSSSNAVSSASTTTASTAAGSSFEDIKGAPISSILETKEGTKKVYHLHYARTLDTESEKLFSASEFIPHAMSPRAGYLAYIEKYYTSASKPTKLHLLNLHTNQKLQWMIGFHADRIVSWSSDDRYVVVGNNTEMKIFDTTMNKEVKHFASNVYTSLVTWTSANQIIYTRRDMRDVFPGFRQDMGVIDLYDFSTGENIRLVDSSKRVSVGYSITSPHSAEGKLIVRDNKLTYLHAELSQERGTEKITQKYKYIEYDLITKQRTEVEQDKTFQSLAAEIKGALPELSKGHYLYLLPYSNNKEWYLLNVRKSTGESYAGNPFTTFVKAYVFNTKDIKNTLTPISRLEKNTYQVSWSSLETHYLALDK
jgi:hypothetical protein